jgi:hypothetical protein
VDALVGASAAIAVPASAKTLAAAAAIKRTFMANLLELVISKQWQRGMLASAYAWSVPANTR